MTTVQTIELIIREIAEVGVDDEDFSTSIDLFDYGYLDSFGIVNLIAAIQESFGVDMMNIDFYGEDIRTLEAISATIMKQNT